jgi:hypothetical protein
MKPREAGLLNHNIMFHKNSFLLQGSKIVTHFNYGGANSVCVCVSMMARSVRIAELPLYLQVICEQLVEKQAM